MIDVLKRLAELDAANPNIVTRHVKESGDDPQMAGLQKMLSTATEPWEKAQLQWRIKNLQGQQSVAGEPGAGVGGPRDAAGNLIPVLPSKEWMAKNPSVVKQLPREALPPEMQSNDAMGRLRDLFKEEPEETTDQPSPSDNTNEPNWLVTPDEAKASQDEEERLSKLDTANPNAIREEAGTVSCSSCGEKFKIAGRKDGFSHCKDHEGHKAIDESVSLEECGPMGMPSEVEHHTPASINMTADSGPELSGMLADIMKLAGVHKVEPEHLGIEHEPVTITAVPGAAVGAAAADHDLAGHDHGDSVEVVDEPSDMRRMMDMMNPDMDDHEDEVDESGYSNTPNDPNVIPDFNPEIYANHENTPGQGDRMDGNMPKAHIAFEQKLMAEWQQFVTESSQNAAEGRVDQLPTRGADYSKYDTDHLKMLLRPGILHRNEARFKALIHKELQKREQQDQQDQQDQQGVAEGDSGAKYRVKSVGNDVNPATDERCDYYINPVTDKKVYCKPGQKVKVGDHVNPTTGKVTPKG